MAHSDPLKVLGSRVNLVTWRKDAGTQGEKPQKYVPQKLQNRPLPSVRLPSCARHWSDDYSVAGVASTPHSTGWAPSLENLSSFIERRQSFYGNVTIW